MFKNLLKVGVASVVTSLTLPVYAQAPANDDCTDATALTPSEFCSPTTGTFNEATTSVVPTCGFENYGDVWYSFVATNENVLISAGLTSISGTTYAEFGVEAFEGGCSGISLDCATGYMDDLGDSEPAVIALQGLTVGEEYHILVWSDYNDAMIALGNFEICLVNAIEGADECTDAPLISELAYTNIPATATQSLAAVECETYTSLATTNDVWYRFVPVSTGNLTVAVNQFATDVVSEFFSGTCGSLTSVACLDENDDVTFSVTAGDTYYMRSYGYEGDIGPFYIEFSGVPLPVDMTELQGALRHGRPFLSWMTTKEVNNLGFEIQMSYDGKSFNAVGFVNSLAAGGNSTQQLHYSFSDKQLSGKAFYRLKQVDIDGKSAYSNTVALSATTSTGTFDVYPTNTTGNVFLRNVAAGGTIQVLDLSGKVLLHKEADESLSNLDLSNFAAGVYLVRYTTSQGSDTKKVVKM